MEAPTALGFSRSGAGWKVTGTVTVSTNPGRYVALGDSFAAGTGALTYLAGSGGRFRSRGAYPRLISKNVLDVTCSGASTKTLRATQLHALSARTAIVTVTIGGNDVGLPGLLELCNHLTFIDCERQLGPGTRRGLRFLRGELTKLYLEIARRAPNARVFVVQYPNPFPSREPPSCPDAFGLRLRDIPFFWRVVSSLDATVDNAVRDAETQLARSRRVVELDSVSVDSTGHDACSRSSWFHPLGLPLQAALHPNLAGNRAMANAVIQAAASGQRLALVGRSPASTLCDEHALRRRSYVTLIVRVPTA